uniref:Uncharacterized protein n=1 Tax=Hucho hucho TaxID=62062 RepID=A0A4W5LYU3_9TELE
MFWRMSDQLAFETLYVASLRGKAKTYAVGECIFFLLLSSDTVLDIGQRAFLAPSLGVCWLTSATVAMGDVISTHLDEAKREMITAHTRQVTVEFGHVYKQQYAVALFNSVRFEIEGGGGPQSQLLHRKARGQPGNDCLWHSFTLLLFLCLPLFFSRAICPSSIFYLHKNSAKKETSSHCQLCLFSAN